MKENIRSLYDLSIDESAELDKRYEAIRKMKEIRSKGPEDEEQTFVSENINLVHFTLRKYMGRKPTDPDYEDLFQEGCIGLTLAYRRYDHSKGEFSTYAVRVIKGCIQLYLRDKVQLIKESRRARGLAKKIQAADMEKRSAEEIQEHFGSTKKMAVTALELIKLKYYNRVSSLNELVFEDNDGVEVIDQNGVTDDTSLIDSDAGLFLQSLDTRSKRILKGTLEGMSQTDIGKELGVSQVHISRVLSKIRTKAADYFQLEGEAV